MIRVPVHTLIRSQGDKVALMGMIGDAAARYTWRVSGAPEGYYSVASHRLAGLCSPLEMLSAAREHGYPHDYPHITDVMTQYPVTWLAETKVANLHYIATIMPHTDGRTLVTVRKEFPGRLDIGLSVNARLIEEGYVAVHLYTLREVLSSLPSGNTRVGLIARDEYRKALCIEVVDSIPSAVYYIPQPGYGLEVFIRR